MNNLTQFALKDLDLDSFDSEKYIIEKSMDDKNIVKAIINNKSIYIGSKYSVHRDIDNFMKQIGEYNINTIFVIFGLATGEHILHLLDNISDKNKILIIEPDENIIKLFLKEVEYAKKVVDDKRIVLLSCDDSKFTKIISGFIEDFGINNIKYIAFSNYYKYYSEQYLLCNKEIKNFIKANVVNIMTEKYFSQQFFKCFLKNIKYISESTLINDVKGFFKNMPAIVVSAGPSLEKNIGQLKDVQDKFLILSGGRTISSLKKVNVVPDLVAVIDPGEPSYEVIKDSLDCKAPLVFCEVTNYKVVEEYFGEKIFIQEGHNLGNVTKEILGKNVDSIFQGGSVAHTCTSLAEYLGCNPIIFIGQDFAYTNNKLHADIACIEKDNIAYDNLVFADDINGEKVPTSELFNVYRRNMESFINSHPTTIFINSTEGGANIKGTKIMDLKEAIKKYGTKNIEMNKFDITKNKANGIKKEIVKDKMEQKLNDMENLKEDCVKALEYSEKILIYEEILKSNKEAVKASVTSINFAGEKLADIKNILKDNGNKK